MGRARPVTAVVATVGSALAFAGAGAATRSLGGNPAGMVAGTIVMAIAAALVLAPPARAGALLLVWNGLGIASGLFLVGMFSVGALIAFPLALIALALAAWPRDEDEPVLTWPAIVVQVGGFLLALALSGPRAAIWSGLATLVRG